MRGTVTMGASDAAEFVPLISDLVVEELGFRPYPGTLNLTNTTGIDQLPTVEVSDGSLGTDDCHGVKFSPCSVNGVRSAVVKPLVDGYPAGKCELIAPVHLRRTFDIDDGDTVHLSKPSIQMGINKGDVDIRELTEFDGVVFEVNRILDRLDGEFPTSEASPAVDGPIGTLRHVIHRTADLDCNIGICAVGDPMTIERVLEEIDLRRDVSTITATDTRRRSDILRKYISSIDTAPGNIVLVGIDSIDGSIARDVNVSYLDLTQINLPG